MANCHANWLRAMVAPLRAGKHTAWANTCERAADEIEALQRHRDTLLAERTESVPQRGTVHADDCDITLRRNSRSNEIGRCTCVLSPQKGTIR
jgi:hypothetical protein